MIEPIKALARSNNTEWAITAIARLYTLEAKRLPQDGAPKTLSFCGLVSAILPLYKGEFYLAAALAVVFGGLLWHYSRLYSDVLRRQKIISDMVEQAGYVVEPPGIYGDGSYSIRPFSDAKDQG